MSVTPVDSGAAPAMGVVGGGTMGVGIVYVFAAAGWQVTVVEPDEVRAQGLQVSLVEAAHSAMACKGSDARVTCRRVCTL